MRKYLQFIFVRSTRTLAALQMFKPRFTSSHTRRITSVHFFKNHLYDGGKFPSVKDTEQQ